MVVVGAVSGESENDAERQQAVRVSVNERAEYLGNTGGY